MRRRDVFRLGAGACSIGLAVVARAQAARTGSTALQLLRTGDIGALPVIDVAIDGAPTRWLVDSGSTTALVSPALAMRLKLTRLSAARVATAGGVQTLERYAMPALPGLGNGGASAVAIDLDAVVGASGATLDGVLGAAWLRDMVTTFDLARGQLRWTQTAASASPEGAVLPLRWDAGLPVVRLALGARAPEGFLFDTGNAGALVIFAVRAQALLAEAGGLPETTVRELGGNVRARHARIERLVAPGFVAREVPAALEADGTARRGGHFDRLAGSLGAALFEAGAVTLDGPGNRLIVELPGLPEPAPLPGGFGLALGRQSGGSLTVNAVIDGGPAAAAGIAAGDGVSAIDGADARGWSPAHAWQVLAGRDKARFDTTRDGAAARHIALQRQRFFPLLR